MGTFLDDLVKKMKTAPHAGLSPVTNPKMPTKVERDTAAYAARQKEMPDFHFGTGTPLERLKAHMASTPHPTPTYAAPSFKKGVARYKAKNGTLIDLNDVWTEACVENGILQIHWYFFNRETIELTETESYHLSELAKNENVSDCKIIVTVALDDMTRDDYKEFVRSELQKVVDELKNKTISNGNPSDKAHELKCEIKFYNVQYFDAEEQDLYFKPKDIEIYTVGRSDNVFTEAANDITRTKFFSDKAHILDNMDDMNPWYCECTGLYYLWKHSKAKIVGLEHYRRYFGNNNRQFLRAKEIKTLLTKYDCICASYKVHKKRYNFLNTHVNRNIIVECEKFWRYAKLNTKPYRNKVAYTADANMFIAPSSLLNEYASYIFPLMKKWIKDSKFNKEKNKRIIGYIFEVTFGYWLEVIAKKRIYLADLIKVEGIQSKKHPVSNSKTINYANFVKLYVAYHKPELKAKLRTKKFDVPYNTAATITEDNLNNFHDFYGEFTQMYYVWKNNKYSPYVGFSNWRAQIDLPNKLSHNFTPQRKVCERRTLKGGFIFSHGKPLFDEMITSIKKLHGDNSKYLLPFNGTTFYMGGHGIYKWDFFVKCMEFTWGIMNDICTRNNLNTYNDYVKFSNRMLKKRTDWCHPDQKQDHHYLFFGYIFERLITIFIVTNGGEK